MGGAARVRVSLRAGERTWRESRLPGAEWSSFSGGGQRVFAVRGGSERGKPVVGRPTTQNRYRAKIFTLCVDTAKEIVYSRFRIGSPGSGYCHVPEWIDSEYAAQLTAEKTIRKWVKNRGTVREWIKIRERNEALDLEVYCLAALYILGPTFVKSLPERAAAFARTLTTSSKEKPESPLSRRCGWVDGGGVSRSRLSV